MIFKIPRMMLHKLENGYTINLKKVPVKGSVCVYLLKDRFIERKIEYGKHTSKYKYSLSGSMLHLPLSLNINDEVFIMYYYNIQCNTREERQELERCGVLLSEEEMNKYKEENV